MLLILICKRKSLEIYVNTSCLNIGKFEANITIWLWNCSIAVVGCCKYWEYWYFDKVNVAYHAKPKLSAIKCIPTGLLRFERIVIELNSSFQRNPTRKNASLVDALLPVEFVMLRRLPFDKKSVCMCVHVWKSSENNENSLHCVIQRTDCSRSSPYICRYLTLNSPSILPDLDKCFEQDSFFVSSTLDDHSIMTTQIAFHKFICYQNQSLKQFRPKIFRMAHTTQMSGAIFATDSTSLGSIDTGWRSKQKRFSNNNAKQQKSTESQSNLSNVVGCVCVCKIECSKRHCNCFLVLRRSSLQIPKYWHFYITQRHTCWIEANRSVCSITSGTTSFL